MEIAISERAPRRTALVLTTQALVVGALVALVVLTAGLPASAGTQTSVSDPAGDAAFGAPDFMDVVSASVTKSGRTFGFRMSVAAPIPAVPPLTPPGTNAHFWTWPLDTNPTTFPAGYPFPAAPGKAAPAEFFISVTWDGSSLSAFLFDRRPLLSGGEVVVTPLAFTISGTDVRVDVRASLLDNPSGFSWGALTFHWSGPPGTAGGHFVDALAPFYNPSPS